MKRFFGILSIFWVVSSCGIFEVKPESSSSQEVESSVAVSVSSEAASVSSKSASVSSKAVSLSSSQSSSSEIAVSSASSVEVSSSSVSSEVVVIVPIETNVVVPIETNVVAVETNIVPQYDRMKDVSYSNAVAYLQESLKNEDKAPTPDNKLQTGKAFLLLLTVLKQRYKEFGAKGFTEVGFSVQEFDNYKNFARLKFNDVINDKASGDTLVSEAKRRMAELESLSLK